MHNKVLGTTENQQGHMPVTQALGGGSGGSEVQGQPGMVDAMSEKNGRRSFVKDDRDRGWSMAIIEYHSECTIAYYIEFKEKSAAKNVF